MNTLAFNLFIAFISSMGFALMFNMPKKWLIPASMGGLGSWAVYLFCQVFMGEVVFVPCLRILEHCDDKGHGALW